MPAAPQKQAQAITMGHIGSGKVCIVKVIVTARMTLAQTRAEKGFSACMAVSFRGVGVQPPLRPRWGCIRAGGEEGSGRSRGVRCGPAAPVRRIRPA